MVKQFIKENIDFMAAGFLLAWALIAPGVPAMAELIEPKAAFALASGAATRALLSLKAGE